VQIPKHVVVSRDKAAP